MICAGGDVAAIAAAGAIGPLVAMLRAAAEDVRTKAAEALCNLTLHGVQGALLGKGLVVVACDKYAHERALFVRCTLKFMLSGDRSAATVRASLRMCSLM